MQQHTIWVSLALTWLFCSASHADEGTRLPCDDPNVQDAVTSVLLAHNKELIEGNQLALYQIFEAAKAKNESGEVLSLHFTARESDCAAGGEKPWQDCDYLQDSSKLLRHCHAKVLLKETNEIFEHQCSVEPPIIAEPRPPCLGCPENVDVYSEDIKEPLSYSISKANLLNEHTHHFILNSIAWATRQVVAGFRYRLQFDLQKSNCTKEDFKDITEECHADPSEQTLINCNSTVDVAPWRHELPDPSVNCEPGPLQTAFTVRRRPPGWSPLRNIHDFQVKPKKEESSEESQEKKALNVVPTQSQSPDPVPPQPEAVVLTPPTTSFNCPGKPWKAFVLKIAPPPPPRPDSNDPVQPGFTDSSPTSDTLLS